MDSFCGRSVCRWSRALAGIVGGSYRYCIWSSYGYSSGYKRYIKTVIETIRTVVYGLIFLGFVCFALAIGIVCECLVYLLEGEKRFLLVGCLIASIGIGISPTELGIIFGLGIALIVLSSIAIRVQENREFRNLKHDLATYESMKRKSGMINLWLGAICCIITIAITGVVAVNIYTIPSLAIIGFGAGKMMKYSFIRRLSPELLSFAIKIKYFYKDTAGLIAKAMDFKMSQRAQRVAV